MEEKDKKQTHTKEDRNLYPGEKAFANGYIDSNIVRKKVKSPEEIIATKKLDIPVCHNAPVNGRIYVISVAGSDMKTPGGLILPPTLAMRKDDSVIGFRRYFVVDWDKDEIPESIQKKLSPGIEVNPFLPEDATNFRLPRVVDWDGSNIYEVLHYTEIAGISRNKPEIVEDEPGSLNSNNNIG